MNKYKIVYNILVGLLIIIGITITILLIVFIEIIPIRTLGLMFKVMTAELDIGVPIMLYIAYIMDKIRPKIGQYGNDFKQRLKVLTIYISLLSVILWFSMNNFRYVNPLDKPVELLILLPLLLCLPLSWILYYRLVHISINDKI